MDATELYLLFEDDSDYEKIIKWKLNEIKHYWEYDNFQPLVLDDVYEKLPEQLPATYQ